MGTCILSSLAVSIFNDMGNLINILLIEDNPYDVQLLTRVLQKSNIEYTLQTVQTKTDFINQFKHNKPDVILSDHSLHEFSSMEALQIVREVDYEIPFILVTGTVSEEFAIECMKAGATDYILKKSMGRLPSAIKNAYSKNELSREKELIKALHSRLTESIRYAKLIQNSLLPTIDSFKVHFQNSFVFNKAKDIVSGDFFWVNKVDDKVLFAIVDCTGHGVPGAFMTIVANNLLNQSVREKNIYQPASILAELNNDLLQIFSHGCEDNSNKNGMDIGLCSINFKKLELEYAGTYIKLVIVREGKLIEINADRFALGQYNKNTFTNNTIRLEYEDTIYLFSDGYIDQFGEATDKKFMRARFHKLLLSIQKLDMEEQRKALNDTLKEWKGNLDQTDDILVVGIKI